MGTIAMLSTQQPVATRLYRSEEDWWRVRTLLIETYRISPPDWNWDVRRWDGSRYHREGGGWESHWDGRVALWETQDGELVGAVHPEGKGEAFLELHPDFRHIEGDLIEWALEHLHKPTGDGLQRQLEILAYQYDAPRQGLLSEHGFERSDDGGVIRRLRFGRWELPLSRMPEGYTLRTPREGDEGEYEAFATLLNAAFNRTFHRASEIRTFRTMCPCYRRDLDLLAEAPDGSLAATVAVTYVEESRVGIFEPVCTHPDHRQKGLARALMGEGMRRLKALGALDVTVGTGDMVPANRLYESVGFDEVYKGCIWRKVW